MTLVRDLDKDCGPWNKGAPTVIAYFIVKCNIYSEEHVECNPHHHLSSEGEHSLPSETLAGSDSFLPPGVTYPKFYNFLPFHIFITFVCLS